MKCTYHTHDVELETKRSGQSALRNPGDSSGHSPARRTSHRRNVPRQERVGPARVQAARISANSVESSGRAAGQWELLDHRPQRSAQPTEGSTPN